MGLEMRFLEPRGSKYHLMECNYCNGACKKAGRQRNDAQKYRCKVCGKYQQATYKNKAYQLDTDAQIVAHVKEGCGIWNIVRLLGIAKGTVISRIQRISKGIKPLEFTLEGCNYEVDEMHTFIGTKDVECYVTYALCRETKQVIDFVTGSRTKLNLERLTGKLLGLLPKRVYTDGLKVYPSLIPSEMHRVGKWGTLRIERKNLTLRVNLKRLARKTICFSRSLEMLEACLKIWFWG
jgi:insertion element IS1 protein InsB